MAVVVLFIFTCRRLLVLRARGEFASGNATRQGSAVNPSSLCNVLFDLDN